MRRFLVVLSLVSFLVLSSGVADDTANAQCSKCKHFDFGWAGGLYACVIHNELGGPDDCRQYGDYCANYEVCVFWYV